MLFLDDTQTICLFSKAVVIDLGHVKKKKTPKPKSNPPEMARVKSQINIISTKLYFHISINCFVYILRFPIFVFHHFVHVLASIQRKHFNPI